MENQGENRRIARVEREIREVIASYLLGGFRRHLPGLVSVTRVVAARDLRQAKVLISVLGTEAEEKEVLETLGQNVHDIQREVNDRLRLKFCPKLQILIDPSLANVLKVETILREIELQRAKENPSETSPENLRENLLENSEAPVGDHLNEDKSSEVFSKVTSKHASH